MMKTRRSAPLPPRSVVVGALDAETDGLRIDCDPLELAVIIRGGLGEPRVHQWSWAEERYGQGPVPTDAEIAIRADQAQARAIHRIPRDLSLVAPSWRRDRGGQAEVYATVRPLDAILCWCCFDAALLEVHARPDGTVPPLLDVELWARALWSPAEGRPHPRIDPPHREGRSLRATAMALGIDVEGTWRLHSALHDALLTMIVAEHLGRWLRQLHGWPLGATDTRGWSATDQARVEAWQREELDARAAEGTHPWARLHESRQLRQAREAACRT